MIVRGARRLLYLLWLPVRIPLTVAAWLPKKVLTAVGLGRRARHRILHSQVTRDLAISPRPPSESGVYLFLGSKDRIMYVGRAYDLASVLYRYAHLQGRDEMRERARQGLVRRVAYIKCRGYVELERRLIGRYSPPWNTQLNSSPRKARSAIPLGRTEIAHIERLAYALANGR